VKIESDDPDSDSTPAAQAAQLYAQLAGPNRFLVMLCTFMEEEHHLLDQNIFDLYKSRAHLHIPASELQTLSCSDVQRVRSTFVCVALLVLLVNIFQTMLKPRTRKC
jgi:hypothetical protein